MPRILITEMKIKSAGGGYRHQRAKMKQTDYHGNRVMREIWVPIEPGNDVYSLGVYELCERSFYVDRNTQQLKLIPRLQWVRALKHLQAAADAAGEVDDVYLPKLEAA